MIFEAIAISAGAGWLISKIVGKVSASNKLQVVLSGRIHKITFSKITVMVNALVKNPSNQTFKFRKPFVTLIYKKETIGLSDVASTEIELAPYSETTIKDIAIDIYLLRLSPVAVDIFKIFQTAKGSIEIEANTLVPYITAAGDVPMNYNEKIVL
jgi:hypothetical protein